ncbi:MAG: 50S ribosomal protein L15 [Archaeoglobaceae archaeon]|nr:50S ribosomal protein L15 [Archaeoglobaceae archaeon]MCX8151443.1 50S ribosomal protein L15 [Archaeoglobaceae archaeon]MDW8014205.1 uL15 family ribosomal protein [Archaeoglobaceae archaeon]
MGKKKVKKMRGSRTHGHGKHKNWRGAGRKGGRGNAGVHKHKYLRFLKLAKLGLYEFGKHGFTRPKSISKKYKIVSNAKTVLRELKDSGKLDDYTYKFLISRPELNVSDLDFIVDRLVSLGLASIENDVYKVDLSKLGFSKLLGSGNIKKRVEVIVQEASSRAVEKISSAGGRVIKL